MPYFVKCTVESVMYGRDLITNNPVNLDCCKYIKKSKYNLYPDNKGYPAITFEGCDAQWVYSSVEARDIDFERISNIQTKGA